MKGFLKILRRMETFLELVFPRCIWKLPEDLKFLLLLVEAQFHFAESPAN